MDIKQSEPKVKKVIRMDAELFKRLAKYAEGVDFPSQNAFYNHIIKAGIDILEDKGAAKESGYTPPDPIKEEPELVKGLNKVVEKSGNKEKKEKKEILKPTDGTINLNFNGKNAAF